MIFNDQNEELYKQKSFSFRIKFTVAESSYRIHILTHQDREQKWNNTFCRKWKIFSGITKFNDPLFGHWHMEKSVCSSCILLSKTIKSCNCRVIGRSVSFLFLTYCILFYIFIFHTQVNFFSLDIAPHYTFSSFTSA